MHLLSRNVVAANLLTATKRVASPPTSPSCQSLSGATPPRLRRVSLLVRSLLVRGATGKRQRGRLRAASFFVAHQPPMSAALA